MDKRQGFTSVALNVSHMAGKIEENSIVEQIRQIREGKENGFQSVKKDVDKLEKVLDMVGGTTDLQTLSLPIIEKFVDRVKIFNGDEMRVHFVFEDVMGENMAE